MNAWTIWTSEPSFMCFQGPFNPVNGDCEEPLVSVPVPGQFGQRFIKTAETSKSTASLKRYTATLSKYLQMIYTGWGQALPQPHKTCFCYCWTSIFVTSIVNNSFDANTPIQHQEIQVSPSPSPWPKGATSNNRDVDFCWRLAKHAQTCKLTYTLIPHCHTPAKTSVTPTIAGSGPPSEIIWPQFKTKLADAIGTVSSRLKLPQVPPPPYYLLLTT